MDTEQAVSDDELALLAHGLLGRLTTIRGALETLAEQWEEVSPSDRRQLFEMGLGAVVDAVETLTLVALGRPTEALASAHGEAASGPQRFEGPQHAVR